MSNQLVSRRALLSAGAALSVVPSIVSAEAKVKQPVAELGEGRNCIVIDGWVLTQEDVQKLEIANAL